MSTEDKANLLMLCGALHDIAELLKWHPLSNQIFTIQEKIELIVSKP